MTYSVGDAVRVLKEGKMYGWIGKVAHVDTWWYMTNYDVCFPNDSTRYPFASDELEPIDKDHCFHKYELMVSFTTMDKQCIHCGKKLT